MAGTCRAGLWPGLGTWGEPELRIKPLQDLEDFSGHVSFPLKEHGLLSFFGVAFFQKPPNSTFGRLVEAHGDGAVVTPGQSGWGARVAREERDSASSSQRGQDSFPGSSSQKAAGLTLVKQAELCFSVCPSALGGMAPPVSAAPSARPVEPQLLPWAWLSTDRGPGIWRESFWSHKSKTDPGYCVFKKKEGGKETKKAIRAPLTSSPALF